MLPSWHNSSFVILNAVPRIAISSNEYFSLNIICPRWMTVFINPLTAEEWYTGCSIANEEWPTFSRDPEPETWITKKVKQFSHRPKWTFISGNILSLTHRREIVFWLTLLHTCKYFWSSGSHSGIILDFLVRESMEKFRDNFFWRDYL